MFLIKKKFVLKRVEVLLSGFLCVFAKLMERRLLFSFFFFLKVLVIILCFFNLIGLFEGFLNIL